MEDAIADYDNLKKERSIKKGLLTRSVNKLRSVVNCGDNAQADTVDTARCRARHMLEQMFCASGNWMTMMWMARLTIQMKRHLQTSVLVNGLWCSIWEKVPGDNIACINDEIQAHVIQEWHVMEVAKCCRQHLLQT